MIEKEPDFGCARCDVRWSGLRTCHCGECHITTVGLGSFDAHRDRRRNVCKTPEEAGLVDAGRKYLCYAEPGDVAEVLE